MKKGSFRIRMLSKRDVSSILIFVGYFLMSILLFMIILESYNYSISLTHWSILIGIIIIVSPALTIAGACIGASNEISQKRFILNWGLVVLMIILVFLILSTLVLT